MSKSNTYTTIGVVPLSLLVTKCVTKMNAVDLLRFLSRLISLTFQWTAGQTDGVTVVETISRRHHGEYHADMLEHVNLYNFPTKRLCNVCSTSKTLLSTLNTYSLSKLYQVPPTLYGNALFIAEIDVEGNHQPV